ncbi:unnamed protein product [Gadus morhua 'NCC']
MISASIYNRSRFFRNGVSPSLHVIEGVFDHHRSEIRVRQRWIFDRSPKKTETHSTEDNSEVGRRMCHKNN